MSEEFESGHTYVEKSVKEAKPKLSKVDTFFKTLCRQKYESLIKDTECSRCGTRFSTSFGVTYEYCEACSEHQARVQTL